MKMSFFLSIKFFDSRFNLCMSMQCLFVEFFITLPQSNRELNAETCMKISFFVIKHCYIVQIRKRSLKTMIQRQLCYISSYYHLTSHHIVIVFWVNFKIFLHDVFWHESRYRSKIDASIFHKKQFDSLQIDNWFCLYCIVYFWRIFLRNKKADENKIKQCCVKCFQRNVSKRYSFSLFI